MAQARSMSTSVRGLTAKVPAKVLAELSRTLRGMELEGAGCPFWASSAVFSCRTGLCSASRVLEKAMRGVVPGNLVG